ncbi:hypothetical protein AB0G85_07345 [Streptomyces sioyaensis]|uniref:hypothetical protein n=1 Tax=Streptomyces sioyaensis TaxID=67364 RepID=UPI0033EE02FF
MAGAGYDVDPAVLKAQGGAFKDIGSDFSAAAKKLAATLKEAEDWGDDDLIKYFMDVYSPVSAGLVESMPTLGEGLSAIGEKAGGGGRALRHHRAGSARSPRQVRGEPSQIRELTSNQLGTSPYTPHTPTKIRFRGES